MGKSAGNCNTELMATYLNEFYGKNYDISEILNAIDLEILKYREIAKWGYQITYYLAAANKCHPNYVKFLENKNRLRIKEINAILEQIEPEKLLNYDEKYITELYIKYQQKNINDTQVYKKLSENLKGSSVVLIGPGSSIKKDYDKIDKFIKETKAVTFSVNHINSLFNTDFIFVSNSKRYDQFIDFYQKADYQPKLIVTSNIESDESTGAYTVNYSQLSNPDSPAGDNSLYLVMKMLVKLNVKEIYLAGFDGFSKYAQNYFDKTLQFKSTDANDITLEISKLIKEIKQYAKVEFLTESNYQRGADE